jgi:hypothetical protein
VKILKHKRRSLFLGLEKAAPSGRQQLKNWIGGQDNCIRLRGGFYVETGNLGATGS